MLKLLQYYLPYKRLLALAVLCNLLMSLFMLITIPVLQPFLQILFSDQNSTQLLGLPAKGGDISSAFSQFFLDLIATHGREHALVIVCVMLVLSFLGKNLFRYLSVYFLAPVRNGIVRDFRQRLLDKMLALPLSYFSNTRKGDLMSRVTSDVQEIEWSIVGVLEAVVREPVVILGSLSFMIYMSPTLTLFVFGLMIFTGVVIGSIGRNLRKQSGEVQSRLGMVVSLVEETLSGLRIIKGFNAESYQKKRFAKENEAYTRNLTSLYRRRDLASPLSEFLGITVVAILLWYGSKLVFSGSMRAEAFITFLYAFYNVIDPAKSFSQALYSIRKGMGALERVEQVLSADDIIQNKPDAIALKEFTDKIEFKNVSFRYENSERDVLHHINLTIPRGTIVALVGTSGAGKSTIADLVPRFYDVIGGQILIDGHDIRDVQLTDLRDLMGIVSQEAILFNDTIENNIVFGASKEDAFSQQRLEGAAKAANAHDFILETTEGYASNIGDRGNKLSGGQRQRLTIARALYKNPPILILDEATSALDSESEQLVQSALDRLLHNRTALVIAHRLSTVQHADEIIVMDNGSIAERGTHAFLMEHGKIYKKLVELQEL